MVTISFRLFRGKERKREGERRGRKREDKKGRKREREKEEEREISRLRIFMQNPRGILRYITSYVWAHFFLVYIS